MAIQLNGEALKTSHVKIPKRARKPPKCHMCENTLEVVYENEYWTYAFSSKAGTYSGELVDVEIRCPYCNASLRRIFPAGVCCYELGNVRQ